MKKDESENFTIEVNCLEELEFLQKKFDAEGNSIYRGQSNSEWKLETSFDRMYGASDKKVSRIAYEISLLKRFQRESHHYGITNIDFLNIPEWLTLMQHYGAPTRLLDWTHSFWVGLFFAIIDVAKSDAKENFCALWVADWRKIDRNVPKSVAEIYKRDHNLLDINDFNRVNKETGIVKLNSFKQNARQIIQQGTFLFPLNIQKTFEDNWDYDSVLNKIIIPSRLKGSIIKLLYRMNISYATLYPGIEGFSRSLGHLHNIDNILVIEKNIKSYSDYKKKFRKE